MRILLFTLLTVVFAPAALAEVCARDLDCSDSRWCNGIERCMPGNARADARGCVRALPSCRADQNCDEGRRQCLAASCNVGSMDVDGDGHKSIQCGGADCDDRDANRYPGNTEVCDAVGHDEDCDAQTFGDRDTDRDGYIDYLCAFPR